MAKKAHICKVYQKSEASGSFNLELPHSKKDHDKFIKKYKPIISSFTYSDFNPDSEEYEVTEINVIKSSELKIKFKEVKKKMNVILESAKVEISFAKSDSEQEERFLDKDWSEEWIEPTICFEGPKPGDTIYLPYENNSLFTLELS